MLSLFQNKSERRISGSDQRKSATSISASLGHGSRGLFWAATHEFAFLRQFLGSLALFGALFWAKPEPIWWVLAALTCCSVLSFELFNSALEVSLDRLHPSRNQLIQIAKDLACAAVLMGNLAQAVVGITVIVLKLQ